MPYYCLCLIRLEEGINEHMAATPGNNLSTLGLGVSVVFHGFDYVSGRNRAFWFWKGSSSSSFLHSMPGNLAGLYIEVVAGVAYVLTFSFAIEVGRARQRQQRRRRRNAACDIGQKSESQTAASDA